MKFKNCFATAAVSLAVAGPLWAAETVPVEPQPATPVAAPAVAPLSDQMRAIRDRINLLETRQKLAFLDDKDKFELL